MKKENNTMFTLILLPYQALKNKKSAELNETSSHCSF